MREKLIVLVLIFCIFAIGCEAKLKESKSPTGSTETPITAESPVTANAPTLTNAPTTEEDNTSFNISTIGNAKAGDIVTFGHYEQDNDTTNGAELIEWIILKVEENRTLVVSKYALDNVQILREQQGFTDIWVDSNARMWLNDDFFNSAFTEHEKERIITSLITSEVDALYENFFNDSLDKIFLLSKDEAVEYLASTIGLDCVATAYALAQGVPQSIYSTQISMDDNCWWATRNGTSGGDYYIVKGSTVGFKATDYEKAAGIRPAMRIRTGEFPDQELPADDWVKPTPIPTSTPKP